MKRKLLLLLTALFLLPSVAQARVCEIEVDIVAAIKPDRTKEYWSLFRANMGQEALDCCTNCLIEKGTKVVITDMGIASHTIRVLDGKNKGCVGDIISEAVKSCYSSKK